MNMKATDEIFDEKIDTFIRHISDFKFIIEITKLCGYSEFTIVFKDSTLIDLYASVAMQMRCRNFDIYLPDSNEKVPTSPLIKLRDFIRDKKLKPIYSINRPCVYKLILDDKHI